MIDCSPASPRLRSARRRGAHRRHTRRSAVTELAEGVTVTADPATNSLVIQASKEGFDALEVIEKLDIPRPQVLVEALILEVDVTDAIDLGFTACDPSTGSTATRSAR